MKTNFVPQTKTEAVVQYVAVAREYSRRDSFFARGIARKVIRKAKAIKRAGNWETVLWQPLSDF